MNAALERTWTASLGRMREWRAGHDPTPVYETLGWAVVLSLTGDLAARPAREIDELEQMGRRALTDDDDERDADKDTGTGRDEDHEYALTLARAGASALTGTLSVSDARGDLIPPSPRRIRRMLTGDVDGLAAASCALHLARRDGVVCVVGPGGAKMNDNDRG
ncbi:MAG: hypothetical protein DRJ42_23075 [Deltaproteobacteria bacterium]|nr:MAG: hypothetical protein DRJ42_23075 [Deltaproteobacteria bacterium]